MRRVRAGVGSAVFFVAAPGSVAGLVPWWLTRWRVDWPSGAVWWVPRTLGAALIAVAAWVLVAAFVRFVREGLGTPAPVAPTESLVVGGWYRFVRNPMYVAVVAAIAGQGLALGRWVLAVYAVVAWAVMASFVRWYEEPVLAGRFGTDYASYRRAVRAWLPRARPHRGLPPDTFG